MTQAGKDVDPLMAMMSEGAASSVSSSSSAALWNKAAAADADAGNGGGETLSAVDFSRVKLKEAKTKVDQQATTTTNGDGEPVENKDRFGLGVDLFGEKLKPKQKAGSVFDDIVTEADTNNVFVNAQEDAKDADNDLLKGVKVNVNNSKQEVRVTHEREDDKLSDLKITGLLEEEELDFDMFGKASGKLRSGHEGRSELNKGTASITSVKASDFEVGSKISDEYLASLDAATTGKDLSKRQVNAAITNSGYQQSSISAAASDAAAALDLGSLDLNSYISQQTDAPKGGLFD